MDADKNILDDEYMMALFYLYLQEQTNTRKLLNKLESDLRLSNRFFPESKLCDAIKNLSKVSLCTLKKGSTLYRCRLISKEDENLLFSKITTEWFSLAQAVVPTFDVNGGDEEWIKFCLYVKNHPEALPPWQERHEQLLEKYSKISFWGYDEKGSDAPPKGTASSGRINPDGISYLYAANDIQTAVLEVRPIPTQFVSVAQVELLEDVTIYSFIKPSSLEADKSDPFDWVDYDEISRYFGQPNYGGKSYYLATQYISEYIKHLKDSNDQTICDGLCFRSSLNPSGTNYVLFDVSQSKKYRICNSSIYQVNDLLGNTSCILPVSDSHF